MKQNATNMDMTNNISLFTQTLILFFPLSQAKEGVAALLNDPMTDGPSLPTRLGASATAGFTAALFSLPFDLIKSRLMAMKPDPITGEMPYKGIVDCTVKIAQKEGPLGFFNGFSAYYGRCAGRNYKKRWLCPKYSRVFAFSPRASFGAFNMVAGTAITRDTV